ncbi:MAG: tetraacyldisaccharide 4'-kinase, partial [Pseudomonadota bacterium]|nr:tetraacyldisaccharide 4'-kinase [Pseudomonadota bacterium]
YTAFCGIAQPEKFKESLHEIGIKSLSLDAFADHHSFTAAELNALMQKAKVQGGRLITTEKDFVRIPEGPWKDMLDVLPVILDFEDPIAVKTFIEQHLSSEV